MKWSPEDIEAIQQSITQFIRTHTTKELEAGSIKRGLLLSPVNPVDAVVQDEQLAARDFWKEIDHPELGSALTYQRFTYLSTEGTNEIRFRAPLIGEHNSAIYGGNSALRQTLFISQKSGDHLMVTGGQSWQCNKARSRI